MPLGKGGAEAWLIWDVDQEKGISGRPASLAREVKFDYSAIGLSGKGTWIQKVYKKLLFFVGAML